ncbi:MAG: amidase [Acidobacteria bacterium]|nr:amidase [Acidobacteriota bacterium]
MSTTDDTPPGLRVPVPLMEATVADLRVAVDLGVLTIVDLARAVRARIDAYDREEPALRAMLAVNPRLDEDAADLDLRRDDRDHLPLFGVPLVVKDNLDVLGFPTTSGSMVLRDLQPVGDATVVARLRAAGALIVGKTNMTELAFGGSSLSSLGGQTLNPYDLTRTPGGSSGGTGAALAASYAVLGLGTDTGQSVRSPASACALVGLRPTHGLISRHGMAPFSPTQDEIGPLARTVDDVARMLDVIAGTDAADPDTRDAEARRAQTYVDAVDAAGLRGARIGLLTSFLGTERHHAPVNAVVRRVVARMTRLGATVMPVGIDGLDGLTDGLSLMSLEFADAFADYMARYGTAAPVQSLGALVARGLSPPSLVDGLRRDAKQIGQSQSDAHARMLARRDDLRAAILRTFDDKRLDAVLYPHQRRLVVPVGEEQVERNGVLSNGTGLPAIAFPGGFSPPTANAPIGVPVGVELLGRAWSEHRLIALASAYERGFQPRRPPSSTLSLE